MNRNRPRRRQYRPPTPIIVKLQRSLGSSDGTETVLVYDRERTFTYVHPMTDELRGKYFPNGEAKVYVAAEIVDTLLNLGQVVQEQDW